MRTLLQNKFAVICFLAAAVVVWWFNGPTAAGSKAGTDAVSVPTPVGESAPDPIVMPPVLAVDAVLADWSVPAGGDGDGAGRGRLREDPFAYRAAVVPVSEAGDTGDSAPPELVLQAISIEGDKALAVVSRRVLACGETVKDWRVLRIEPEEVWVEGASGVFVLRFQRAPVAVTDPALAGGMPANSTPDRRDAARP